MGDVKPKKEEKPQRYEIGPVAGDSAESTQKKFDAGIEALVKQLHKGKATEELPAATDLLYRVVIVDKKNDKNSVTISDGDGWQQLERKAKAAAMLSTGDVKRAYEMRGVVMLTGPQYEAVHASRPPAGPSHYSRDVSSDMSGVGGPFR